MRNQAPMMVVPERERIKCPYCFKTFGHKDVAFRMEESSAEEIKELKELALWQTDDEVLREQYKNQLRLCQRFNRVRDSELLAFWEKMGAGSNAALFESSDGYDECSDGTRKSVLGDDQEPVIGAGVNADLVNTFLFDETGFVTGVVDVRGKESKHRVCPHCHNKLPEGYGKYPVKLIALVGISGSGKTVMLSQLIKNMEDYANLAGADVTYEEKDSTAARFVKNYRVSMHNKLPEGTKEHFSPPIFLQFSKSQGQALQRSTLVIYDIAGESCIKGEGIEKFGPFIQNSDGIILLLDPKQISDFSCAEEDAEKPTAVINAMASAFLLQNDQKSNVPIAVAFSKSDKLQFAGVDISENSNIFKRIEYADGRGFMLDSYKNVRFEVETLLRRYSRTFHDKVEHSFSNVGYFAFSSLGHETELQQQEDGKSVMVPIMNIEPIRLEEPFLWLLYKHGMIEGVTRQPKEEERRGFRLFGGRR